MPEYEFLLQNWSVEGICTFYTSEIVWVSQSHNKFNYIMSVSTLICWIIFSFILRFNFAINNFSVMSGQSHRFLGINQFSRELMSCTGTQHGDTRGNQTQDLSIQSYTLPPGYRVPSYIILHQPKRKRKKRMNK